MKKIWLLIGIIIVAAGIITWRFFSSPAPPEKITLINPLGPAAIPVAGISSNQVQGDVPLEVQFWKTPDEAVALLAADKAEFAVLPITEAANIYAKDINIKMLGVHEWKVFYLAATGGVSFEGWDSLKGKKIYTPHGRGQTVDILIRSALSERGIDPDRDLEILYTSPQEIVSLFKAGKMDFAALPEPFATLAIQGEAGSIVLDFQEYWGKTNNIPERLPIAGLFVKKEFFEKYPEITQDVSQVFAQSTEWSNENADQALEVVGEVLPIPEPVMKTALSRIDFYFVPINKCREEVEFFLDKMHELYPQGISQLPDEDFYSR